ncbi:hypothetical protein KJ618_00965 [Patescibacteria group bacterium]|nr:hypothetical protein [Patescibacteria group bacterium]
MQRNWEKPRRTIGGVIVVYYTPHIGIRALAPPNCAMSRVRIVLKRRMASGVRGGKSGQQNAGDGAKAPTPILYRGWCSDAERQLGTNPEMKRKLHASVKTRCDRMRESQRRSLTCSPTAMVDG